MNFDFQHNTYFLLALILTVSSVSGQLCQGNLGLNNFEDGDFGSGTANVLQTDPNIAPGYTYNNNEVSPNDGFYTITNNTGSWGFRFPAWLSVRDNSDDPNGYMMVVNASFQPGLFYRQQVDDLCENTLYEFSADILNLIRIPVSDHIEPNIDFLIDNVVRFSTGDVPQDAEWHEYGFTFTTDPGQTSVSLSLRNNAPGGNGNDLALDNISFQACGPDAFVTAEQTIFLCEDENTPVTIESEIAASNQALQWQFSLDSMLWEDLIGETSPSIIHSTFDVGRYYYRYISAGSISELLNERCRIFSDVLVVEILAREYMISDTICADENYSFGTESLTTSGNYTESFISSRGCDSIVDLTLAVLPDEILNVDENLADPSCFGAADGSIQINLTNGTYPPYGYAINEVSTPDDFFSGLIAGAYTITITNGQGCTKTFDYTLTDPALFEITVPNDTIVSLGESIDVQVTSNYSLANLSWTPDISPCGACTEFSFIPLSSQEYVATATNANDCIATAAFQVTVDIEDLDIYIPNVFDPSLSGVDQTFTIGAKEGLISEVVDFSIYDRWGNLIHNIQNTNDLSLWDGRINNKSVNPAVFVYLLTVELIDGEQYVFAGDVFVLK